MKNTNIYKFAVALSIFLIPAVSITACSNGSAPVSLISESAASSLVTTEGSAEVSSDFDRAGISVGISVLKPTATEAQTEASMLIDKINAAIKSTGIEEKDINTDNYYMSPEYDYQNNKSVLKGYRISQNLSVSNIGLDNLGTLLKATGDAGATNINSIYFYFSNEDALYNQALEKAVANARAKADILAKTAGKQISSIKIITEGNKNVSNYYSYNDLFANSATKEAAIESYSVPTGEGKVSAIVTVSFEMK